MHSLYCDMFTVLTFSIFAHNENGGILHVENQIQKLAGRF